MDSLPTIPTETVKTIIDDIATDVSSLKMCSLVCQEFLAICRGHIFSTIVVHGSTSHTTAMLQQLLTNSPHLAQYIHNLKYFIRLDEFSNPQLVDVFLQFTKLRSLDIIYRARVMGEICTWTSPPIRRVVLPMLHLPTLTQFRLSGIRGFDVADLIPCANLKELDFGHILAVKQGHGSAPGTELDFPFLGPAKPAQLERLITGKRGITTAKKLYTARRPDGETIVDFSTLKSLSVTYDDEEVVTDIDSQELFSHCTHLTAIDISVLSSESALFGFAETIKPFMHTLRELEFKISIPFSNGVPFLGLAHEFEEMANHAGNKVQSIRLQITIPADHLKRPGESWRVLDIALTRAGWSSLRQVHFLITAHQCRIGVPVLDMAKSMKDAANEVRETQFIQLSASKRVHFTFELNEWYSSSAMDYPIII